MSKNLFTQLCRKSLAERIADRCEVRNLIQQAISQKPSVSHVDLNVPVRLAKRWYSEQMLDEYHLYKDYRICARPTVVMAVIRLQPFIQPFVIHDLFDLSKQMVFRHQCVYVYDDWRFSRISFPVFHPLAPLLILYQKNPACGEVL